MNNSANCHQDFEVGISVADQYFYGHGKLLLSGEYFVLDGSRALALPVSFGQSMSITYSVSYTPVLYWKSLDSDGNVWFEARFEFWRFDILDENQTKETIFLQKVLRQARKQNPHFLRDGVDVHVTTKLNFSRDWGLGSSSSLLYNIAQWAYVAPFELFFNISNGSGYDIACAQSKGPIVYEKRESGPKWSLVNFNPPFKDSLYFVYLGKKQDSKEAVEYYSVNRPYSPELITNLSAITNDMVDAQTLDQFDFLINAHEYLVSEGLNMPRVKDLLFEDFWGEMKSLGAWGGDFILVTSSRSANETKEYFSEKGYEVFFPFSELILSSSSRSLH